MKSKVRKIRDMIGDYFDNDGDTFWYFMDEIDKIEKKGVYEE